MTRSARAGGRADPSAPASARRYLLESERLVFAVRRHPAVLAGSVSIYVVVLAVVVLLLWAGRDVGAIATTGLVVLLIGTGWFAWKLGDWAVERFTVTDRRVLLVTGVLTRRVAIMPLRKVTDLTFERSISGRLFGYGAFVMESAGQQQALSRIDFLPHPERLYQQVSDLLFGRGHDVSDPDEDGTEPAPRPRVVSVGSPRGDVDRRRSPGHPADPTVVHPTTVHPTVVHPTAGPPAGSPPGATAPLPPTAQPAAAPRRRPLGR